MNNIDFVVLLPEILLLSITLVMCCYGLYIQQAIYKDYLRSTNLIYSGAVSIELLKNYNIPTFTPTSQLISVSKLGIIATIICYYTQPFESTVLCSNTLITDSFTYYFKLLLLFSIFTLFILSEKYLKKQHINFESIILIILSTISMLLLISAFDFITIYLTIELQSLSFYILGASKRNSEFSTEAGLKYFILGAFSSGILLLGFSIIYSFTGATNFEQLWKIIASFQEISHDGIFNVNELNDTAVFVGFLLISIGFLFKLTAAPFHLWAADVYEGSPITVTTLFSTAPKIAVLAIMLRLFVYSVNSDSATLQMSIFILCSIVSMIVGAFAALSQNKIKRLLTFSGIGHVGFFLMGLACGTMDGCAAIFVALFVYIVMTISIFTIIHALRPAQVQYIEDLGSIETNGPLIATTLAITMFSYAGIPPLAGFCSKLYLIFAAVSCGSIINVFVAILTSVISCFYYIRLVKIMYFETPNTNRIPVSINLSGSILLAINTFILVLFFFYPSPIFSIAHIIASNCAL